MNTTKARELRKNPTEAERILWKHLRLRQLGHKFRRQQPLGPYIVDFVCLEKRLIVEVDGGQHSEQVAYDAERCAWLEAQGFRVLRFWNHEVLKEIEVVKDVIAEALGCGVNVPLTSVLPQGGRKCNRESSRKGKGNVSYHIPQGEGGSVGYRIESYSISNVNLQVECENKQLTKKVIGAIDDYFFMTKESLACNFHNINRLCCINRNGYGKGMVSLIL